MVTPACWTRNVLVAGLLAAGLGACATTTPPSTLLAAVRPALAPAGFLDLCRRDPGECRDETPDAPAPRFSPAVWSELVAANDLVNHRMRPRTDMEVYGEEEHWASASDPQDRGDCEDFALAKRRELVRMGYPKSALAMAVVFSARTGRHAVLVASTSEGDYVLDSLSPWVRPWRSAGYMFLERENRDWLTWASVESAPLLDNARSEPRLTIAQLQSVPALRDAAATAAVALAPAPGS